MTDFLLEIGCEEVPSRFVPRIEDSLCDRFKEACEKQRLTFESVQSYATYRRFVICIKGLADKQTDLELEIKGPPHSIAYDESGQLTKAGQGFLKKNNVDAERIKHITEGGREYIAVEQFKKGDSTENVLPSLITTVITSLPLPLAMTWGRAEHVFIRPVHWVLALYGESLVDFSVLGVKSDRKTFGHRLLSDPQSFSGKEIEVDSVSDYFEKLTIEGKVLLDSSERKSSISASLNKVGQKIFDEDLVEEVSYLVEQPYPLEGEFDKRFLTCPDEVLIECMKSHQRYFPIIQSDQRLSNRFVLVADSITEENKDTVIKGNERVLTARLTDALFFWEEDRKQRLEDFSEKLKGVVFQKGMGSVHDKVSRMNTIMSGFFKSVSLNVDSTVAQRAVTLSKCDLVTQMVFEFPKLQGVMGRYYAEHSREDDAVSKALEEQYYPLSAGGNLPESELGAALGIVDRIDTLVVSFCNGKIPTGSQDPLGLRRAANGVLSNLHAFKWSISIEDLVNSAYEVLAKVANKDSLMSFLDQRIKTFLVENGLRYDVADSVLHIAYYSVSKAIEQGRLLQGYRESSLDTFKQLVETAVRVKRLAKKSEADTVLSDLFRESCESETYETLCSLRKNGNLTIESRDALSQPLIRYFDTILVMDEDESVRKNRLAFLKQCDDFYMQCADFEYIVLD